MSHHKCQELGRKMEAPLWENIDRKWDRFKISNHYLQKLLIYYVLTLCSGLMNEILWSIRWGGIGLIRDRLKSGIIKKKILMSFNQCPEILASHFSTHELWETVRFVVTGHRGIAHMFWQFYVLSRGTVFVKLAERLTFVAWSIFFKTLKVTSHGAR